MLLSELAFDFVQILFVHKRTSRRRVDHFFMTEWWFGHGGREGIGIEEDDLAGLKGRSERFLCAVAEKRGNEASRGGAIGGVP